MANCTDWFQLFYIEQTIEILYTVRVLSWPTRPWSCIVYSCLHMPSYRSFNAIKPFEKKFQGFDAKSFTGSEKDFYFLKIPKWQYKSAEKRWWKCSFYVLNSAAKTGLYELKVSKNLEMKFVFYFKAYFFIHGTNFKQVV